MSEDMTQKYQQHYNQVLSGTLTDIMMKSITYQANIKLANEIIAEQDKSLIDLKKELEDIKNQKNDSENSKIVTLENSLKLNSETITKLNSELLLLKKMKTDYENVKVNASNVEVFRTELVKERELHQQTKNYFEETVNDLKKKIALLETPPKKKKSNKQTTIVESIDVGNSSDVTETTVKDGGSF